MTIKKLVKGKEDHLYFVFRVLVGLMFLSHGLQKIFGWFGGVGGGTVDYFSLLGLAGGIEIVAGLFIVIGLFTQTAAFLGAIEMAVAYFMVHMPQGFVPLANSGEPVVLFFAAFLVLMAFGSGKWALGKSSGKK